MGKHVLNIELNEKSINEAIAYLKKYESSIDEKVEVLIDRLAEVGINVINAVMMSVAPVDRGEYNATKTEDGKHSVTITLSGDEVLFIEYSAGVTFGTTTFESLPNNPSYGDGMGVGTYPGQTHAEDPEGWWYVDRYGQAQHTYGVRAYAPMFQADMEMRSKIVDIAKEVFG